MFSGLDPFWLFLRKKTASRQVDNLLIKGGLRGWKMWILLPCANGGNNWRMLNSQVVTSWDLEKKSSRFILTSMLTHDNVLNAHHPTATFFCHFFLGNHYSLTTIPTIPSKSAKMSLRVFGRPLSPRSFSDGSIYLKLWNVTKSTGNESIPIKSDHLKPRFFEILTRIHRVSCESLLR